MAEKKRGKFKNGTKRRILIKHSFDVAFDAAGMGSEAFNP